jgi:hypothetical protein
VDLDNSSAGLSPVITAAPDAFTIVFNRDSGSRVTNFPVLWKDVQVTGTDGTDTVQSNPFSVCFMWVFMGDDSYATPNAQPFSGYLGVDQTFLIAAVVPEAGSVVFSVDGSFQNGVVGSAAISVGGTSVPATCVANISEEHPVGSYPVVLNAYAVVTIPAVAYGGVTLPEQVFSLTQPMTLMED